MDNQKRPKRKYELKQRAADMAATRLRITEAAVELHGSVGPARTTLSDVAKRAGVQRHTLYRHFATEADLFTACSSHYLAANPWPNPTAWRTISDPQQRLAHALEELYAYYERTEPMFSNVLRDAELVPALQPTLVPLQALMRDAVAILMAGWPTRGRRRQVLAAALRHAIGFDTWRSLAADKTLTRTEAVELVTALVSAAARSQRSPAAPDRRGASAVPRPEAEASNAALTHRQG